MPAPELCDVVLRSDFGENKSFLALRAQSRKTYLKKAESHDCQNRRGRGEDRSSMGSGFRLAGSRQATKGPGHSGSRSHRINPTSPHITVQPQTAPQPCNSTTTTSPSSKLPGLSRHPHPPPRRTPQPPCLWLLTTSRS